MLKDRIRQAERILESCGLDALVLFNLPSIRYLCGFTGTDGVLVVTRGATCFQTDSRYTTQARQQVLASEVREYRQKTEGVCDYLLQSGVRSVGFEAETLPYATVMKLQEKTADDIRWTPLEKELQPLRGTKGPEELASLEAAACLNAEAFAEILPEIRPGVSEKAVALALEFALKRRGGEEKAFDFIVASGVRGALPHGLASDKLIAAGELVTIDFGTRVNGYHSDETVTLAVGEVEPRLQEIFDIVLEAHDRAIATVRPGIPLQEVDAVAREFIASRGYGDYFGHGLGHGVGLEIHEYPIVSGRSEAVAAPGMVFTVEPGIYIPEFGGVRIEDTIVVTDEGCRNLTQLPKGLRVV